MPDNDDLATYTVWVGGIPDVEGATAEFAQDVYQEWIDKGYDDVQIEKVEFNPDHWDNSCQTLRRLA